MYRKRGGVVAALTILAAATPVGAQSYRMLDAEPPARLAEFGAALAVGDDFVLIGEPNMRTGPGVVFIYREVGDRWAEAGRIVASDGARGDDFGSALALEGDRLLVGATGAADGLGAIYAFERAGQSWREVGTLTAPGLAEDSDFGATVALDGDVALVGA
ncbi:MAG: hypothetical protein ACRELV_00380, partial [Longimicrobiales bacterium]